VAQLEISRGFMVCLKKLFFAVMAFGLRGKLRVALAWATAVDKRWSLCFFPLFFPWFFAVYFFI